MYKAARLFAVLALVGVLATAPAMASSQKSIVGTWQSQVASLPTSLFTFNADGTLTGSANTAQASGGHGVWRKTGPNQWEAKNVGFLYGADGNAEYILEAEFDFVLNAGGNTASSPNIVVTLKALDGTVVSVTTLSSTLTRISLD